MRKSSLVSLVPFISSRIQTGVMPRPDHFTDLLPLLSYLVRLGSLSFARRYGFDNRRSLLRDVASELRKLALEIGRVAH